METVLGELATDKDRGGEALRAHILGEGTTLLKHRDSNLAGMRESSR